MSSDTKPLPVESKRPGFLDLPEEIQKEIVNHCSQSDWICLSLVSSHFRELAAAQLYRNFHIVFPDEDDTSFDSPIDGLAGGLDTFVTSDYNYAKHLRDLSLDTLSTGSKAELAYKSYLFSVSCGKFMNTLLLLTLRNAKSLDTFRWNIRVELSRPVYRALHNISSLRHLHLRLQAGPSLYESPPPLSAWVTESSNPAVAFIEPFAGQPSVNIAPLSEIPVSFILPSNPLPPVPTSTSLSVPKPAAEKPSKESKLAKEPTTLSGFKQLETLAILDIDNLDIVTEVKSCVRNSASTLRKLKLSFSDNLATQARRPNLDVEPEDSDQEDDFQVVAVPAPAQYNDGSGPAKIFRAQEERKAQEAFLGRIFELEPSLEKEHEPTPEEPSKADKENPVHDAGQAFIDAVEKASRSMWANLEGSSEFDVVSQQEAIDNIVTAAKLYVESKESKAGENTSTEVLRNAPVGTDLTTAGSAPPKGSEEQNELSTAGKISTSGNVLFGAHFNAKDIDTKPEDIDVAAPEEQLGIDGQDESNTESHLNDPAPTKSPVDSHKVSSRVNKAIAILRQNLQLLQLLKKSLQLKQDANELFKEIEQSDGIRTAEVVDRLNSMHLDITKMPHEVDVVGAEGRDITGPKIQTGSKRDDKEEIRRQVTDYARGTRGIALESLAIHLIPTRASVLNRAVDLRTLKKITLLNVGQQTSIWALMIKENKLQPLPLRKIFTDNVCPFFLQLVSQLDRVDEIMMLERGLRFKPESFAQKTRVNIDQIRKTILRKHMETLKVLMIKNEADSSWDVEEKTMQLICRRGKVLEELAVSVGIRAMHTFLQHLTSLTNLFALHVVSFRSDDTCVSVMREMRRFIVDTLSHHPELRLEWIAMGDNGRAQRIMRQVDPPKKAKETKKDKEKWKGPPVDVNGHLNESGYPVFPAHGWEVDSESDEDDDDTTLRLDLTEDMAFYDIWGVRIFRKEIMAGRL